ncbi:cytochrome b/b6 domain-containing protein [Ferrimonas balearica]|uniref:cytochrome b/b6 domain-containing protein n=1 Tax=Ferrimonas balearica TaxID=44012 RepID=UPI001C95D130|nr:cytochrome b/b6 domain-containing protein [Ferrimonas balearica]MBY5982115.1 cytochrome b/b6 domain-containing protein [Ferrimonas balearica]
MTGIYTWDRVVKSTHWLVAILFLANYFALEEGSSPHQWAGYIILLSLGIRFVWGMITNSPARLSRFPPSIRGALTHLREVYQTRSDRHEGHNPAGAIMIWIMWAGLVATALSGWSLEYSPWAEQEWLEEVHETFANITLMAVTIHISAVILMTKITGKRYIRSMTR